MSAPLFFDGIPGDVPEQAAAVARSRLARTFEELAAHTRAGQVVLRVGRAGASRPAPGSPAADHDVRAASDEEATIETLARQYAAEPPRFGFDQLVIPADQREALLTAVAAIRLRPRVYGEWGLRRIEPAPSVALNLHGPPGTGKSLAAHAIAANLGMPIISAGYAELESKFHGDGPKRVKAAFHAAEAQGALLFLDEADSLLSRRLTDVTQGSEQAINSMRSQIVLCLDRFTGVVVFATNLVANYDRAFESRVRHFHFALPGPEARLAIWRKLLVPELPLGAGVDLDRLCAVTEGFSGREVKLAVLTAAERVAVDGRPVVDQADFETAITRLRSARAELAEFAEAGKREGRPATPAERAVIESGLQAQGVLEESA